MASTKLANLVPNGVADTAANGNTVAMRDPQGNLSGNTVEGTTIETSGGLIVAVSTQTAAFTADNTCTEYFCDLTVAAFAVTMPSAASNAGRVYHFWKTDVAAHTLTITGVLGVNTIAAQYGHLRVSSDGTNWFGK